MNSRQIAEIESKFHIKVNLVKQIAPAVYRITSPKGKQYCLKRMRTSPSQLIWIDMVMRKLVAGGFRSVVWRVTQKPSDKLYGKISPYKHRFILTPWVTGRTPISTSGVDLRAVSKTLASFHKAGRFVRIAAPSSRNQLGRWPHQLKNWYRILQHFVNQAKRRKEGTPLDLLLQKHGAELLDRAKQALLVLSRSQYHAACRQAAKTGVLSHGDSGPLNFVISREGPMMIDFETLQVDLPAYDLFRMIRLACKTGGWRFSIARHILDGYRSVTKLKRNDYDLLQVWLMFPFKACKTLSSYNSASTANKRKLVDELRLAIRDEKNLNAVLQGLKRYKRKHAAS